MAAAAAAGVGGNGDVGNETYAPPISVSRPATGPVPISGDATSVGALSSGPTALPSTFGGAPAVHGATSKVGGIALSSNNITGEGATPAPVAATLVANSCFQPSSAALGHQHTAHNLFGGGPCPTTAASSACANAGSAACPAAASSYSASSSFCSVAAACAMQSHASLCHPLHSAGGSLARPAQPVVPPPPTVLGPSSGHGAPAPIGDGALIGSGASGGARLPLRSEPNASTAVADI